MVLVQALPHFVHVQIKMTDVVRGWHCIYALQGNWPVLFLHMKFDPAIVVLWYVSSSDGLQSVCLSLSCLTMLFQS